MCLISYGWRQSPGSRLLLVANRDEFHARPTAAADWWQTEGSLNTNSLGVMSTDVLGGRDLQAGGSWLGVNRAGYVAALTNFREVPVTGKRSRGELVSRFLLGSNSAAEAAAELHAERCEYAGFNLLLADADELYYVSNRCDSEPVSLAPGFYGLSNALLNSPWPKSLKTTAALSEQVDGSLDALLDIFADREQADDSLLPVTAMPMEWEKILSSPFICTPEYGTRASTGLSIAASGEVNFSERRFGPAGDTVDSSHFRFRAAS